MNLVALVPVDRSGVNIAASVSDTGFLDSLSVEIEDNVDAIEVASQVSDSLSLKFDELVKRLSLSAASIPGYFHVYRDIHVLFLKCSRDAEKFFNVNIHHQWITKAKYNRMFDLGEVGESLTPLMATICRFWFDDSNSNRVQTPTIITKVRKLLLD